MIGIFADNHLSQYSWTGQPLLDRLGEPLGAHHVAGTRLAGVLAPHVLDHHHAGRDVLELLTDLLADADAKGSAVGTRKQFGGDVVELAAAGQVLGQRLAAVTGLLGRRWLGGGYSLLGWVRRWPRGRPQPPRGAREQRARAGWGRASPTCGRRSVARVARADVGACR